MPLLQLQSYKLLFRHPFAIAHGLREGTDAVFVKLLLDNHVGFGEATLPPYLPDTVDSVSSFLNNPILLDLPWNDHPDELANKIDQLFEGNFPAKAALNMAHWQVYLAQHPDQNSFPTSSTHVPHTYTLGIDNRAAMEEKIEFAKNQGFRYFKLKLNGVADLRIIRDYLELCHFPFAVDANQSWNETNLQDDVLSLLNGNSCFLIEQPFIKDNYTSNFELRKKTDIPIIADESCQTFGDISKLSNYFDGINIKLQKCGGISAAKKMIDEARRLNMKVLIGCMSESSVGCNSAELLAPLCDWADLDGPWLIKNDPDPIQLFGSE